MNTCIPTTIWCPCWGYLKWQFIKLIHISLYLSQSCHFIFNISFHLPAWHSDIYIDLLSNHHVNIPFTIHIRHWNVSYENEKIYVFSYSVLAPRLEFSRRQMLIKATPSNFTEDFGSVIQFRWRITFSAIPFMILNALQLFAHAPTAKLLCHLQSIWAITSVENMFPSIAFVLRWENHWWNGFWVDNRWLEIDGGTGSARPLASSSGSKDVLCK